MTTKNIVRRVLILATFLIMIGAAFYFDVFFLGAATVRNETSCIDALCSGSNSKLTAVQNGDYIKSPKGPNPMSNDSIGAVCCSGDWRIDSRGGNWWSECNGSATGWGACVDSPAGGTQSIVACSFPRRTGTCTGYNSKITGIGWNGLDQGYICCDGTWTQTAAPIYCKDYTCDTQWTGDCNGKGNGYVSGGFYQCGYPNSGNGNPNGTPALTVTSPSGGTFIAGAAIPIRWQTSGFANRYANIQLALVNVSLDPNHPAGAYGQYVEAYDDGTEDMVITANMLTGLYYAQVRACNPDYLGGACVEKKSGNFNIVASGAGDSSGSVSGSNPAPGSGTGTGTTPAPTPTPAPSGSLGTFKIITESLSSGKVGESYSVFLSAVNGGSESFSWSVVGSLPTGLAISNSSCATSPCQGPGRLTGTPTTAGTYSFTVKVSAGIQSAVKTFSLNIAAAGGGGGAPTPTPTPTPTPIPGADNSSSAVAWQALGGITVGGYFSSIVIDPANSQTVYAGTMGGVFKSTDGGDSWTAMNTGLTNTKVSVLVIDRTSRNLYAGTQDGLFKSTNGGASWSAIDAGFPNRYIGSLAVDPVNNQVIYVGLAVGSIFKTTNGGAFWTKMNFGLATESSNYTISSLAIDPTNSQTVYAGTLSNGIYKTVNGGTSWEAINNGFILDQNGRVSSIAIDPANNQTIYVTTRGNSIFKSTNGGASWTFLLRDWQNNGLRNTGWTYSVAIDPANSDIVYLGTYQLGVYRTINGGANWAVFNNDLIKWSDVHSLAIDPTNSQTIYAGAYSGLYKTTSAGSRNPDSTPAGSAALLRVSGQDKVYRIISGKALWVPTLAAFSAQGLNWNNVQVISAATLAQYPLARLIQAEGDSKVYYLTDAGQKRHLINEAVFNSYGNSWANVVRVSAAILNSYANAVLIKAPDTHRVYKIENGKRRWIKTDTIFRRLNLNWSEVSLVNATELNAYPEGEEIE